MNRRLSRIALSLAIVGVTAAGLVFASLSKPVPGIESAVRHPALLVNTIRVRAENGYEYAREFTGRVQAKRISELGFEQSGRLVQVLVQEGDRVAEGDVLARLDTERLVARRNELEAAHGEAVAEMTLARLTLDRLDDIVDRGAVSHQSLDDARQAWRAAQARANRVERQIDAVEVDLAKTRLNAPFSGIITRRLADEGRVLAAGNPVLVLQEASAPEFRMGVGGRMLDQMQLGEVYPFRWRGRTINARLRTVLPVRSATARTVEVLFDPLDAPADIRPGDLLHLELRQRISEPGSWLPISTLTEGRQGLWDVYVVQPEDGSVAIGLDATHRTVRRSVSILYQEADRVYVRGTLAPSDQVVLDGLQRLVPKQWVRVNPVNDADGNALASIGEDEKNG